MYVCVCNAVTDKDIHQAVAQGCKNLRDLRSQLGVSGDCGRCAGCAREVLHDALHQRKACAAQHTVSRVPHPATLQPFASAAA